ncbi:hypothetical protein [Ideonella sp. YS5]|uniref:hypothetical protein n=1 Tax=Ideonella sp. YS5 TaxID=3453714 RepID=UPI003EECA26B
MGFEQQVGWGLAALFGGLPLWALVGWLASRGQGGFESGAGTALLLFGLTGLGAAGWVAWFIHGHPEAVAALEDPRQPYAMVGVFGAFGGFGVLGGSVLLASGSRQRRARLERAREPAPVSAERERWGSSFTIAGNVAIMGCAVATAFLDLSAVQGTTLMFSGVVAGCACFFVAFACKGLLSLEAALILILVGGGFALALAALRYLG